MKKLDLKNIGNITVQFCKLAGCGLIIAASRKIMEYVNEDNDNTVGGYDDAVGAIMNSTMFSHDKHEAVTILKRDGDYGYYKAIIHVVNVPDMFSHDKVKMINALSEKQ